MKRRERIRLFCASYASSRLLIRCPVSRRNRRCFAFDRAWAGRVACAPEISLEFDLCLAIFGVIKSG